MVHEEVPDRLQIIGIGRGRGNFSGAAGVVRGRDPPRAPVGILRGPVGVSEMGSLPLIVPLRFPSPNAVPASAAVRCLRAGRAPPSPLPPHSQQVNPAPLPPPGQGKQNPLGGKRNPSGAAPSPHARGEAP